MGKNKNNLPIWNTRIKKEKTNLFKKVGASISIDKRLFKEDIEASSDMTSEERQDMISGMVEGLANRLESEGGTSEEWARLIRALSVLGEIKRAQKVWLESQKIFSSSPNDLKIINNTATEVGISE